MIILSELLKATAGSVYGQVAAERFEGFAYDSRITQAGQMFVAVVTETGDGHDYVVDACRRGATGVLCERPPQDLPNGVTCVLVPHSLQALAEYARQVLRRRQVAVIGITGSVGKTSAKEAVAAVLGRRNAVFRTPGNYSGRLGLPIALGDLMPGQELAVLEMACDSRGELAELVDIARPQIGVITRIGYAHSLYLGSRREIAEEKGRLLEALPADGYALLCTDDDTFATLARRSRAPLFTYGLTSEAELWADRVSVDAEGTSARLHWDGQRYRMRIPLIGRQHVYTMLIATALGLLHELPWEEIAQGLGMLSPLPGRTNLLPGINGSRLLDDSYSASPLSARAAMETLATLPARRRIAVLGDMTQLGDYTESGHRSLGQSCATVCDLLVAKGDLAHLAARAAREAGMEDEAVKTVHTAEDVVRLLRNRIGPGDLILLKGGREARLERVAASLLAPEVGAVGAATQVLPRQNAGWQQVRLRQPGRPTWVEIDLEAVAGNVRRLLDLIGPEVKLMAVLKADAYGHGAVKVARTALNNGAHWLGVACLGEAIVLRQAGIDAPILILGYTPAWQARQAVLHDVTVTAFSRQVAESLSRAAQDLGRVARIHVKVDTGMGRLGLFPDELPDYARYLDSLPGIVLDGLFSHLSSADEADLTYTRGQLARFEEAVDGLRRYNLLPSHLHIANSAATLRLPESHYTMVRPGIALYGLAPSSEVALAEGFRPALSFKCEVAQVKSLPAGSYVGYGRAYRTTRPSRIAVIPVGYADGFRRSPRRWPAVLVRGQRVPLVGNVCMDQTMIDVTDVPGVRQGDPVVLIGSQGGQTLTVEEVAEHLGTINYEVVSEILARVPRVI